MASFPKYEPLLADRAAAILRDAECGDNAAQASAHASAHAILLDQHRGFFLKEAFGINLMGVPLPGIDPKNCFNKHKKVKSVNLYNDMVRVLSNWGDSDWLASAADNDLDAIATF
jgi:hypothetical protein